MSSRRADVDEQMSQIASLGEPTRRELYRWVAAQPDQVSRDQAAEAVGVPRHVAKFHLDRLEADGLLTAAYGRPAGRGGPGAGRPTKWYRRARVDVAVSLPERRYDLAARVMADAIARAVGSGSPVDETLRESAIATGRELGKAVRDRASGSVTTEQVAQTLDAYGFEPRCSDDRVELANCPFHLLAQQHTELVCRMNLDMINGVLGELGAEQLTAVLDPGQGRCCVRIVRRG